MSINLDNALSSLKMNNLFVHDISFSNTGNTVNEVTTPANIQLNVQTTPSPESDDFEVKLSFEIKKPEIYTLIFTLIGKFSVSGGLGESNAYLKNNAVAIMFPYARTQITLLTTHPGITPIVIPPVNINTLLKDKS